jgi:hypothetical protein
MAVSVQQAGGAEESKMADTTPLLQNGSAQVSGAYMGFQSRKTDRYVGN